MKRTVFNNFHEPSVVSKHNWVGHIVISKGEKSETETYLAENTTRIKAKNQFLEIAKRLKGDLTYINAI